ncbi:MAG: hypothetical protein K2X38_02330 [Gemmataceae bacterium]|nr:hypothetical protein [Gemmataceae bacterium]
MTQIAYKFRATIGADGKLEWFLPLAEGTPIEVVVLAPNDDDDFEELRNAAARSLDFWDNALDDEDWNNA